MTLMNARAFHWMSPLLLLPSIVSEYGRYSLLAKKEQTRIVNIVSELTCFDIRLISNDLTEFCRNDIPAPL